MMERERFRVHGAVTERQCHVGGYRATDMHALEQLGQRVYVGERPLPLPRKRPLLAVLRRWLLLRRSTWQ